MDRSELAIKKQRLKNKLLVDEQNRQLADHYVEYLEALKANDIQFHIEYLVYTDEVMKEFWLNVIDTAPWASFNIKPEMIRTEGVNWHEELFKRFPSTLPLRFRPDLPLLQPYAEALEQKDIEQVRSHFIGRSAYLIHTRSSPVIQIMDAGEQLHALPFMHLENVALFTPEFDTILFRSLEEEWLFGSKG